MTNTKWARISPEMVRYATIGIEFILVFGIFLAGGILLDWRLGTRVLFTLIGMAVGFGAGLYRMIRAGRQYLADIRRSDESDDPGAEK